MTNGVKSKTRMRARFRAALAAALVVVLVIVAPPLIGVSHYKSRITQLVSQSLGRPVHLSSVQVRLLPWPGFVLSDLSVAEDPAYGAEPVLHASSVTASIRLLALWRGRLEIGKIGVDEASLNLVRAAPGRWNLDSLFRTAASQSGSGAYARDGVPLPYLEATNSRIDFKNGVEKLPFSLVNTDLSLWQENSGEWRVRLRGQPARTDVPIYPDETGVVRMEASVRRAAALRLMPVHFDLDWRKAQLGQLARMVTGSDPGWRGDLTGELHLDGTADAAQIAMRLRATGVHRAEFTPAAPMDFDANCRLVYRYTQRSLENLACDSPLGDGRVRITGEKPGQDRTPQFVVEMDSIPLAAGLDALRTLRSGIAPDLEAAGTVSGKLVYAPLAAPSAMPAKPARSHRGKRGSVVATPLSGSLTVQDFALSGSGFTKPIQSSKIALEPAAIDRPAPGGPAQALTGTASIPAGGAAPLVFNIRLSLSGYEVAVRGPATIARARELGRAAGLSDNAGFASLAGDPVELDLTAEGPWLAPEEIPLPGVAEAAHAGARVQGSRDPGGLSPGGDTLAGTITVRNANWKADYFASPLVIDEAILHLDSAGFRWDPVAFSYGPVKGTASLALPLNGSLNCPTETPPLPCPVQFQAHFGNLEAASLQTALLGARKPGTLLSDLIRRLRPSSAPPWPQLEGTIEADSFVLGPVTFQNVSAAMRILPSAVEIASFDGEPFGGSVHMRGTLTKPATDRDKPAYSIEGDFDELNAPDLGQLLGVRWTGGAVSGNGKVELDGYTGEDLASSARGTLHLEARQGAISAPKPHLNSSSPKPIPLPAALSRFDRLSADAVIGNGGISFEQSEFVYGSRRHSIAATIEFGDPPSVSFAGPKGQATKHP